MNDSMHYHLSKPSQEELRFASRLRKRAVVRRPRIVYLTGTAKVVRELKREMERQGITHHSLQTAQESRKKWLKPCLMMAMCVRRMP
ncbi:hypothetical protein [Bifidobacterium aquikefiricola]|uniref:Uncharacterized protein n=1 Tax=Bifidobacterium aquikefiricola TaxID=3059038 RepID=A0AB39U423_9BIFI